VDAASVRLDVVRPEDDDDVADVARADALEHRPEQEPLLRRAEPRRGSRGEHDCRDHA
jgi:hypothetical protein